EPDGVPAADAERRQAGGDPSHTLGVLGERDLERAVGGAQRDLAGVAPGDRLERLAHGGGSRRGLDGVRAVLGDCGHQVSFDSRPISSTISRRRSIVLTGSSPTGSTIRVVTPAARNAATRSRMWPAGPTRWSRSSSSRGTAAAAWSLRPARQWSWIVRAA